jgi:multiple sugar transport system ATP-binding protein
MAEIEIEHVNRTFPDGTEAVKDVTLDVADGEFVILVGPSGSGKSTLLRMIAGLEDVTSGVIRIAGDDMTDKAPRDRNLAMVFQDYALYPHMTVRENMEFPLKLRKMSRKDIDEHVQRAADSLELGELLDRKPANLSGGQRQRVAMGRAIVRDPNAFLLDEPLSNLDAQLRVQTRGEISDLQRRLKTTTVYVTHDQTEAMTLGDRVAVLRRGVLQQVAPPKVLYLHPGNIFVAGFIGSPAMNFFPASISDGKVELPLGSYAAPETLHGVTGDVIAGIRPEHFEDVALVGRAEKQGGVSFRTKVDRLEWLGAELFVHFEVPKNRESSTSTGLREVAGELREIGVREEHEALTIARIDPASEIADGDDVELWLDTSRVHYFDAETGENLVPHEEREPVGAPS